MKGAVKIECWEEDGSYTFLHHDQPQKKDLLGENATLLRAVISNDWNTAMKMHHELLGWEPYKPMEDEV